MSTWAQTASGRRPQHNPNGGGVKPLRAFRRQPYPPREERKDTRHQSESYEDFEQREDYLGSADYETYEDSPHQSHPTHQPSAVPSPAGESERGALYQRLYEQFHGNGAKKPADCVVLSVNNKNLDYPKSLGHCLQECGLSVEMLYLQAESGLTRALQDVRSDGSPLCILVEQNNVTLSSCTVIIFSESLKIHRNMPKEQALEFVKVEFGRVQSGRRARDPAQAAAQATELTDDYLERAKLERHFVPSSTRHLLCLMAEGLHLYPEELSTITHYIQNLQGFPSEVDSEANPETLNSVPAGLGNPPPLVPDPIRPTQLFGEHPNPPSGMEPPQGHLMGAPDSYLKTQPPPLLSVDVLQGSTHRLPAPQGPAPPHGPSVLHHGPPPAPHHGAPAAHHGPSSAPQHCSPTASHHCFPSPPHHGPSAPHHGPLTPNHGPPAPHHSHPAPHHGLHAATHHGRTSAPHHGPSDSPHGPPAPHHDPSAPHHNHPTPHHSPGTPHHGPHAPHHSSSAPHGPPASQGPSDPYAPPSSYSPQPPRSSPAPRGPPGLRSLQSPGEAPAPRGPHSPYPSRGPPRLHGPRPSYGPSMLSGTPSQNGPVGPRGPPPPRGPRMPPPALRSLHMGNPIGPASRPVRRLLP